MQKDPALSFGRPPISLVPAQRAELTFFNPILMMGGCSELEDGIFALNFRLHNLPQLMKVRAAFANKNVILCWYNLYQEFDDLHLRQP